MNFISIIARGGNENNRAYINPEMIVSIIVLGRRYDQYDYHYRLTLAGNVTYYIDESDMQKIQKAIDLTVIA